MSALLVIAVALVGLDFYLTRYTARKQVENIVHLLATEARILSSEVAGVPPDQLESWARASGERAQARITIISPEGNVLADSQHDPETMENHSNRPEIREARKGRVGHSIRHSVTLERDLCYVAMPLVRNAPSGEVLRLAVPLEQLDTAISVLRWRILAASLVFALLALVIAWLVSRRITRRIQRLQAFAESLPEASFSKSMPVEGDDELGALTESLNRMAAKLAELVDRLGIESARLEAILASMVEGVLAVNQKMQVIFCNRAFAQALDIRTPIPEQTLLPKVVRDPALLEMVEEVLGSGEAVKKRLQLPSGDGRAFEAQVAPLASRRGAIAILYDITDLERLERVRKDFVANVSHELRTPLTAIQGYAETLLDGALDDKENNRKFLEIIRAHSIRLNNIASDLLVLSELESDRPTPAPERVSLRAALEAALHTVEAEANVRSVALRLGSLEEADVMGQKLRLEQALVNLLDNAVKFNRPGGEVRVAISRLDGTARIMIADTGIGIPSEDLSRIFERFYRTDKARSRQVGGTGLGLSIVKHVIERMHGTVKVESQLGKGSTFTVELPCS